jgi:hypothetical protein
MGLEMYVRSDSTLIPSGDSVTDLDKCSKHNGKRKGLFHRAPQASRLSPAWRSSRRRLIFIQMENFPFSFSKKFCIAQ